MIDDALAVLSAAPLTVVGRVLDASNVALLVRVGDETDGVHAIYKPVRGEQPLWDFPTGYLAHREVAAHLVDAAGGWGVVPPTVLADGPLGPGSVQWWITDVERLLAGAEHTPSDDAHLIDVDTADVEDDPLEGDIVRLQPHGVRDDGWLPVFSGELPDGSEVVVAHADTDELRSVAVLDAVLNNSDRKASHLLRGVDGRLWGIDHGLCLHAQAKLRTILWGWTGRPIPDAEVGRLDALVTALRSDDLPARLGELLTALEVRALTARAEHLLETRTHPRPSPDWPAVPWPPL